MKRFLADIRQKTSGMDRKEAAGYVAAYYWYHILAVLSAAALVLLFTLHYAFGNKKPLFTCVIVNQAADSGRDLEIRDAFAAQAGILAERVVVDSSYQFSYGQMKVQGVNESSYEKFFFQWENHELDAVILPESFYKHCREMGGGFYEVTEKWAAGMERYLAGGAGRAVVLGEDGFAESIAGKADEKLLLAFPVSRDNPKMRKLFLAYISGAAKGESK